MSAAPMPRPARHSPSARALPPAFRVSGISRRRMCCRRVDSQGRSSRDRSMSPSGAQPESMLVEWLILAILRPSRDSWAMHTESQAAASRREARERETTSSTASSVILSRSTATFVTAGFSPIREGGVLSRRTRSPRSALALAVSFEGGVSVISRNHVLGVHGLSLYLRGGFASFSQENLRLQDKPMYFLKLPKKEAPSPRRPRSSPSPSARSTIQANRSRLPEP